jgi:hypothetical protein
MHTATTRVFAAAGVAAPFLWAASVLYFGAAHPEYDPVNQFISELAERGSSTELPMRLIGFAAPGVLIVTFGVFLLSRPIPTAVAALIIIHGLGRIVAGAFPCDHGCPMSGGTLSQSVHNVSAMVNGLTLPAAALLCGINRLTRRLSPSFAWYSLASAVLGLLFLSLMFASRDTRHNVGMYQRLSLGTMSLWLAVLAVFLWPSRRQIPVPSEPEAARSI